MTKATEIAIAAALGCGLILATLSALAFPVKAEGGSTARAEGPAPGGSAAAGVGASGVVATGKPAGVRRLRTYPGVWVEGMGFAVHYGRDYADCEKRCLAETRCVMIEFYRPEKKCNLYGELRKKLKGGSSVVAVKD